MTKEEREKRNYLIFARFLAGHSEREIGRAVGLTGTRIHQILKAELKEASRHRQLLTDEALAVYQDRLEMLVKATWPGVVRGELKAIEEARRLMEQQARLYNFEEQRQPLLPSSAERELIPDDDAIDPDKLDELSRFRMQHRPGKDEETGS